MMPLTTFDGLATPLALLFQLTFIVSWCYQWGTTRIWCSSRVCFMNCAESIWMWKNKSSSLSFCVYFNFLAINSSFSKNTLSSTLSFLVFLINCRLNKIITMTKKKTHLNKSLTSVDFPVRKESQEASNLKWKTQLRDNCFRWTNSLNFIQSLVQSSISSSGPNPVNLVFS